MTILFLLAVFVVGILVGVGIGMIVVGFIILRWGEMVDE